MKRAGIYLAAGLFFLAVALKLAIPGKSSETDILSVLPSAAIEENTAAVLHTFNAGEYLSEVHATHLSDWELPVGLKEEQSKAVAAFFEDQSAYEDLAIPANVSYDVPTLPFACTDPLSGRTSSGFGYRIHPIRGEESFHFGVDLAANSGDDIVSFADGTVSAVGEDEEHGKFICVDHSDGFSTLYAHCSVIYVAEGQHVAMGEKIALVGDTGEATGPNLHFELLHDSIYLNPSFYMLSL